MAFHLPSRLRQSLSRMSEQSQTSVLPTRLFFAYRSAFSSMPGISVVALHVCCGVARSHCETDVYSSGFSETGSIATMRSIPSVRKVSPSCWTAIWSLLPFAPGSVSLMLGERSRTTMAKRLESPPSKAMIPLVSGRAVKRTRAARASVRIARMSHCLSLVYPLDILFASSKNRIAAQGTVWKRRWLTKWMMIGIAIKGSARSIQGCRKLIARLVLASVPPGIASSDVHTIRSSSRDGNLPQSRERSAASASSSWRASVGIDPRFRSVRRTVMYCLPCRQSEPGVRRRSLTLGDRGDGKPRRHAFGIASARSIA